MTIRLSAVLIACALVAVAAPARAADVAHRPAPRVEQAAVDVTNLTWAISSLRRKFFADAMSGLTAQQLETFWSVYADYEKEKNQFASARVEVLNTFLNSVGSAAGLSDADITHAVHDVADLQKKLTDLRMKYFDVYSRRLDVRAAGRFALVDDFVTTSIRLDWLKQIPFPGEEPHR